MKPSCYAPPTRACGAGSPPAGTWAPPAGSWPAVSPPGRLCPCETRRETPRGWAPTPRSPPRPRRRCPGNSREASGRSKGAEGGDAFTGTSFGQSSQSGSVQSGAEHDITACVLAVRQREARREINPVQSGAPRQSTETSSYVPNGAGDAKIKNNVNKNNQTDICELICSN